MVKLLFWVKVSIRVRDRDRVSFRDLASVCNSAPKLQVSRVRVRSSNNNLNPNANHRSLQKMMITAGGEILPGCHYKGSSLKLPELSLQLTLINFLFTVPVHLYSPMVMYDRERL